ncbi:MAG: glycoside hydrolase family 38 C-terminal domain-containing protein [Opitutaceae bacterium]|jgi:alpha-mannosidase
MPHPASSTPAAVRPLVVHLIANAHLDPVWLWNWQAGADEALATFRSAADRCDEYPELIYTRGEAWLYDTVERLDPALFARVRRLHAAGRWSIAAPQWVQPDANLPTLPGWRKQLELGRRYFAEKFGAHPTVAYNVDSFGHPATLPDILAAAGLRGYVFHRPEARQLALPAQTFRWRGPAGGEVTGFRIAPCYTTRGHDLYGQIMLSAEAANPGLGHTMCFFGLGNHGGGPSKATIEWILEHRHDFPGIELRFSTVETFFDAIASSGAELPLLDAELQYTFPGCYSVMHDVKQRQHHGELRLAHAEATLEKFAAGLPDASLQREAVAQAWRDLAFTQFHDVLAGTSMPSAYTGPLAMQGRAAIAAEETLFAATRRWARDVLPPLNEQQLVVFNPGDLAFDGFAEAEPFLDHDDWNGRWLSTFDGRPIPFQLVEPEASTGLMIHRIIFPTTIPPREARHLVLRAGPATSAPEITAPARIDGTGLGNGLVTLRLGDTGIASLCADGEELLGPAGIGLHLRADAGDTWCMNQSAFTEPVAARLDGLRWTTEETGPLRVRAFADGDLGHTRVRWTVELAANRPEIVLRLRVNFAEEHRLLQLPITLSSSPQSRRDGLAGGSVARELAPTEWPFQGWVSLGLGRRTLSLVTADAYSVSVDGAVLQPTLLRAPLMAWFGDRTLKPAAGRRHADQGVHEFTFVLRVDAALHPETLDALHEQLASPLIAFDRYEGMNRPPWGLHTPQRLWTPDMTWAQTNGHPPVPPASH